MTGAPSEPAATVAPTAESNSNHAKDARSATAVADANVLATVPLPATDLPIRDQIPSLQSRAEAGDNLAACRLGMALLRCSALTQYAPDHDAYMAKFEAKLEARGNLGKADNIASGRLLHAELRAACDGIPASLVAQSGRYVRQAALAGEPEAVIRYVQGETLMTYGPMLGYIATPEFDVWRREARPMLMRAMEAGQPEAALVLAEARGGGSSPLAMLFPVDNVEASASLFLVRRLFGDSPALARGVFMGAPVGSPNDPTLPLDEVQLAEAERQAADWYENDFQGRHFALADHTAALLPLHRRIEFEDDGPSWPGHPRAVPCESNRAPTP